MPDLAGRHFTEALNIAAKQSDALGTCRALFQSGKAELQLGDPTQALKLFQLGQLPAGQIKSKIFDAGFVSNAAWAISKLEPGHVERYVDMTWESFSRINPDVEQESVLAYLNKADLLATTGEAWLIAGNTDQAIDDLTEGLALRSPTSIRSRAFESASLATAYLRAGAPTLGVSIGRQAVELAEQSRSARVVVRLASLRETASECAPELARSVEAVTSR